ncbi:tec1p [Saccharomyces arboricola H-6]|uniref:Tec1p n=1 Tax=Saccharomyces arboricola (strain H-6 / AS 2.3317 / CBS 10644) TaxID=1160507 RepID=J8Q539_SACAR|nr:tec1p [Saccharomyces arboricola H-6]
MSLKVGDFNSDSSKNLESYSGRIFDVYIQKDSYSQSSLNDIFPGSIVPNAASVKNEAEDDINLINAAPQFELVNTGLGAKSDDLRSPSVKGAFTDKQRKSEVPNISVNSYLPGQSSESSSTTESWGIGCDKWSESVEEAFFEALRLIMKNGTTKIKIRNANFGRNELISLYIKHKTNEFRTKKQISSHIQVWKKTIQNKVKDSLALSSREEELLHLIEHGAEQTTENSNLFYDIFEEIIDSLPSIHDSGSLTPKNLDTSISSSNALSVHSRLLTPITASNEKKIENFIKINAASQAKTPLIYAKHIYENMDGYKCVPSKRHLEALSPTELHQERGTNKDNFPDKKAILETAKNIEMEQRKIINKYQRISRIQEHESNTEFSSNSNSSSDCESDEEVVPRSTTVPQVQNRPPSYYKNSGMPYPLSKVRARPMYPRPAEEVYNSNYPQGLPQYQSSYFSQLLLSSPQHYENSPHQRNFTPSNQSHGNFY